MVHFILSPADGATVRDIRSMLDAGELRADKVRDNGTTRRYNLVPVGSTERDVAEWIYDQVEDGRSVTAVAREMHTSEADVRRRLLVLELTEEIEAGEWDDVWAEMTGDPIEPQPDEMSNEELAVVFEPTVEDRVAGPQLVRKTRQSRVAGSVAVAPF